MLKTACFTVLTLVTVLASTAHADTATIATGPKATRPIAEGNEILDATLKDSKGNEVFLKQLIGSQPTVLVFFRGGWCPICTRHTGQLIQAYPEIKRQGANLIAISPDSPQSTAKNTSQNSIPFPVYSDSDLSATKAFGLAFQVDDQTITKYKGFGIDLNKASGRDHQALPIPAVYIVDSSGKILFAHSDPDYRQRLDPQVILDNLP